MTFCVLDSNCSVFDAALKLPGHSDRTAICEGCHNRMHSELNLLRYDYVDLSQLVARADGHSDTKISRPKPESVPPIDMGIFTLRGQIAYTLMITDRSVREYLGERQQSGELTVREGFAVDRSIRYLQPRVYELGEMPATWHHWDMTGEHATELTGPQAMLLLSALHRKARRACGLEARSIAVPGYCGSCQAPALMRADDNPERIWCRQCRATVTSSEYLAQQRMVFAPPPA